MVDPSKIHWSNGVDKPIYADIIWVIWIIFLTSPWIWVKRIQMGYSTKLEEFNFGWVSLLDIAYGDYSVVKFNRISNPHWSLGVAIGLQPLINCLTVHVKAWITYGSMTSRNSDARNDKKMSSSGPNSKPKSQPRHSDVPSKFLQATCPLIHTDPTKIPKSRAPKIRFWSSLQHLPAPSLQVAWRMTKTVGSRCLGWEDLLSSESYGIILNGNVDQNLYSKIQNKDGIYGSG